MKFSLVLCFCFFVSAKGVENLARIAGGTAVTISNHPFAAGLLSNYGSGSYQLACGGAIITETAILSAASCFYTDANVHPAAWWRSRVGSSFSNSGGLTYLIRLITPHPSFVPATRVNDVAVLRTTLSMAFQPGVVEAARIVGNAYSFANNQAVFAIGWGATSATDTSPSGQLRQAELWVVNQQTCAERYSDVNFAVNDNMVCVGWLDVGVRGQCQGDRGSPLVDNGNVVGVFSWAEGCANGRYPGINTRVSPYTPWIVATALAA